jgi:hypothetical protein
MPLLITRSDPDLNVPARSNPLLYLHRLGFTTWNGTRLRNLISSSNLISVI